ncbi:TM2 domain-containing protein [Balneolaceae bacterium ANBcel3]|nr:TM2 domain-containing protein [Balneolaceae bacterium ANBcel3]
MEESKVDMFIMSNSKYFEPAHIMPIKEALKKRDDSYFTKVQILGFKDPVICLVISLLAGPLGVDRFYVGDVGLGIAKLLTCGGLGIWTIVDYFLIMGRAREVNYEKMRVALY